MASLIEMIHIYENNKIVFKHQHSFKAALEYIENNKKYLEKEIVYFGDMEEQSLEKEQVCYG